MRLPVLALTLALTLPCLAQVTFDPDRYTPLQSSGSIPEDFTKPMSVKWMQDILRHEKESKSNRRPSLSESEFYLNSNYLLTEMLIGGKVSFNDPLNQYVNKVAARAFEQDPKALEGIRFYIYRSNSTNAFSTHQGMIFITTGLLAKLENEAQLAFILCHEVIHYQEKHGLSTHLENEKVYSRSSYRNTTYDERVKLISKKSKEHETEADSLGFLYFARSRYSLSEAASTMDVLQFSDQPYAERAFHTRYLNNPLIMFPSYRLLSKVDSIKPAKDGDDSRSSHPALDKRKAMLGRMSKGAATGNRQLYLVSEKEFTDCRDMARYEAVRNDLVNRNYADAIYTSSLLLEQYTDSRYLKRSIGKALYAVAKYKQNNRYGHIRTEQDQRQGQIQAWNHFFSEMEAEEAQSLAMGYLYGLCKADPSDTFSLRLFRDVAADFAASSKYSLNDFKRGADEQKRAFDSIQNPAPVAEKPRTSETAIADSLKKALEEMTARYEQLKKNADPWSTGGTSHPEEAAKPKDNKLPYYLAAFGQNTSDPFLVKEFERAVERAGKLSQKNKGENKNLVALNSMSDLENERKQRDKKKEKEATFAASKLVVVDPYYFKIHHKKGLEMVNSEKKQKQLVLSHKECSDAAGLPVEVLDAHGYQEGDVPGFNELSLMNAWLSERFEHGSIEIIPLLSDETSTLISRHGTRYFASTGVLSFKGRREGAGNLLWYCILVPYALPIVAAYAVIPTYNTFYYVLVFDVNTGEPVYFNGRSYRSGSNMSYVNSIMYKVFRDIKKK